MNDRLVLFGTKGGPRLIKGGSWPTSQALVLNGNVYVIDAGLGVTRQFIEAGFTYDQLESIFITHHHSDHNLELGGLIYTSWTGAPAHKINIFGPSGLKRLITHFIESQSFDVVLMSHIFHEIYLFNKENDQVPCSPKEFNIVPGGSIDGGSPLGSHIGIEVESKKKKLIFEAFKGLEKDTKLPATGKTVNELYTGLD